MPSVLMAVTPTTPDHRPRWLRFSSVAPLPEEETMMTPLLIALAIAHLISEPCSELLYEMEMIWAPS